MSISPRNLWPDDISVTEQVPPVAILKEQGSLLGQRTKNLVEGRVSAADAEGPGFSDQDFCYEFDLVAPALGYRYQLFRIQHGVDFYPLGIDWDSPDNVSISNLHGEAGIENEEKFLEALEIIFSSEKTRKVIGSLIAQSRAA